MTTTYYPLKLTDRMMSACLDAFWHGEAPLPAPTYDGMLVTLLADANANNNWVYFGQAQAQHRVLVEFPEDSTTYLFAADNNGYFGFGVHTDDPDFAMANISVTVLQTDDDELWPSVPLGFHPLQLPSKDRFDIYHELMFGDIPKVQVGDFEFTWHTTPEGFTAYFGYGPAHAQLPLPECACAEHRPLQADEAGFVVFGTELPAGLAPELALMMSN
jgi:hypothetical protein